MLRGLLLWRSAYLQTYRGKRLHTRNRHLRKRRGFPVAFSNGFSLAFSDGINCSVVYSKGFTFPVVFHWNCPTNCQRHSPTELHFCDFWCVIFFPRRYRWQEVSSLSRLRRLSFWLVTQLSRLRELRVLLFVFVCFVVVALYLLCFSFSVWDAQRPLHARRWIPDCEIRNKNNSARTIW